MLKLRYKSKFFTLGGMTGLQNMMRQLQQGANPGGLSNLMGFGGKP